MPPSIAPKEDETLLKLNDVHMRFGNVAALVGVDLEVKKGEIHSIIGPNGAGKTVMMNCINGLYKPQQGEIYYKGQKVNNLKPYQRAEVACRFSTTSA
jgi:branched-chain amino acid transport system ATP-binding protein